MYENYHKYLTSIDLMELRLHKLSTKPSCTESFSSMTSDKKRRLNAEVWPRDAPPQTHIFASLVTSWGHVWGD